MSKQKQLLLGFFIIFFSACEDDKSSDEILPEYGIISGEIIFTGTWPDSGDVLLTLNTQYPPTGPPADYMYIMSDSLSNDIYEYNFSDLTFRVYEAITVTYWPAGYGVGGSGSYQSIGIHNDSINVTQENHSHVINIDAVFD